LRETGIKCFVSPGNDDRWEVDEALNKSETITNPEEKVVELDQHHEMITLGLTNHTPWKSAREFEETELAERIDKMAAGVKNMNDCIFNLHCPPYGTVIDPATPHPNSMRHSNRCCREDRWSWRRLAAQRFVTPSRSINHWLDSTATYTNPKELPP
jgi:uncharacterized protein